MKTSTSNARPVMCRTVWILSFLLYSFTASAADNASELQSLYNAVNMLNQEQQTIFQQFQMVQEMLRRNTQSPYGSQGRQVQSMGDFPNYADVVEAQKGVIRREESLYQQADQLMAQYSQIEEQKKPLRERILSLTLSK